MIIEEIKKANIQAMKDKDQKARAIYSVIMNKHLMATVDARTNGKEVEDADMVRIIQKTIKELEEEKIICGYPTLINWEKVEQDERVTAIIEVKVTPQRGQGFDRIAERIYNYPEVTSVYLISGSYDLLVTLESKTLMEVSLFVSEKLSPIESVISTATHFILKKYKDHGTILVKKSESERMPVTL